MPNITKTIVTLTILHDSEISLDHWSIHDIAGELNEGELVGCGEIVSSETVPDDKLSAELEAIGNDGSFFETTDEYED